MMRKRTYERLQGDMIVQIQQFFVDARSCGGNYRDELYLETLRAYLRLNRRNLGGFNVWCVDVAKISVKEQHQGKGHFSIFMDVIDCLNPAEAMYLESIVNPLLRDWTRRHGWTEVPVPPQQTWDYDPSFYRLKRKLCLDGYSNAGLAWESLSLKNLQTYEQWRATRLQRKREQRQGLLAQGS